MANDRFYREGHRRMLYEGEERPAKLVLWVNDVEQAWQIDGREMTPEPINGRDCNCLTTESCPACKTPSRRTTDCTEPDHSFEEL